MLKLEKNFALKEGDRVLVYATVKYDRHYASDSVFVTVDGRHSSSSVDMDAIHGLVVPKFEVGDMVSWNGGSCIGKIAALSETHAWIEAEKGYATADLAHLTPERDRLGDEATTEPPPFAPPELAILAIEPAPVIEPAVAAPDEILF